MTSVPAGTAANDIASNRQLSNQATKKGRDGEPPDLPSPPSEEHLRIRILFGDHRFSLTVHRVKSVSCFRPLMKPLYPESKRVQYPVDPI